MGMKRAQKGTLQHSTSQNWLSVQISSVIPVGDADLGLTDRTSKSSGGLWPMGVSASSLPSQLPR